MAECVVNALHDERITITAALEIDRLPHDKQEKYVTLAEDLSGTKLRALIDKELDKLQQKIEGTEKKKDKEVPDPGSLKEHLKTIKQSSSVVCEGLEYDEEQKSQVKGIRFRALDPDDVGVIAKFMNDVADLVPEDVAFNEKAQEEITNAVESAGQTIKKMFDTESPAFRDGLKRMIGERSQEIAQEKAQESGKRAKVTYAIATEALEEFFCDVPEGQNEEVEND